jgi:hypothetical protein
MSKIVSTAKQVGRNIRRFRAELDGNTELQSRLAYNRAWYADCDDKGDWHFGPSKFVGYQGMTAEEYVNDEPRDGRQTERKLAAWFVQVPESDPLYEELSDLLVDFLEKFGKSPSTLMRINVPKEFYAAYAAGGTAPLDRTIGDLIIAVAQKLAPAERKRIASAM